MKLLLCSIALNASLFASAEDARALLSKARDAYNANRERDRHWNWTTTTHRSIVSASGRELEHLPAVTVESPIQTDGKRCNAVLAWGDGREPYLAGAAADDRCRVEQEIRELLNERSILESARVRVRSRSPRSIVLAVSRDPAAMFSPDRFARCTASVEGTIQLDPVSYYPTIFDLEVTGSGCEQQVPVVNHYDGPQVSTAVSTFRRGAHVLWEYVLQKDKSGDATRDYWICVRRHSVRPLSDDARVLLVWGRRFEMTSTGHSRRIVIDAESKAAELTTDITITFEPVETEKKDKKDK